MRDGLSTDLWISATLRRAACEGIPITVVQKGDPSCGTILLKVATLDGFATVYSEVRLEDEIFWSPAPRANRVPEHEADLYLEKQADFDPDLWIVEVEDKKGRLWFQGRILEG